MPQTLLTWVKRQEIDSGVREGTTSADAQRLNELEREVKELRRANEILKVASAFFAQADLDRRFKCCESSSTSIAIRSWSSRSARFCRFPRPGIDDMQRFCESRNSAAHEPGTTTCWRPRSSESGKPTCRSMVPRRFGVNLLVRGRRQRVSRSKD